MHYPLCCASAFFSSAIVLILFSVFYNVSMFTVAKVAPFSCFLFIKNVP